jgi:hypothetical protein
MKTKRLPLVSIPTRFTFGRFATGSTAAVAAALTLSLSTRAVAIPHHNARYQGTPQAATSPASRGGLRGAIRTFGEPHDPIPGVTITARDQNRGRTFTATSATDGTYELLLPNGRYDVLMAIQGFVTCQVDGVDIGSRVLVADANLTLAGSDGPDDPDVIVTGQVARQPVPVVRAKAVTGCNNQELNHLAHKSPTGWK